MTLTRSGVATQVAKPRDVQDRSRPVWGLCLHTTGAGIVEQAIRLKADPLEYAVAYYLRPKSAEDYFPHYVMGWDGHVVQVADELERAPHVGYNEVQRRRYLNYSWERDVPPRVFAAWHERWPLYASPAHLLPRPDVDFPNNVLVGCEMLPTPRRDPQWGFFTVEQHKAAAMLAADVGDRWMFPHHWWHLPRLAGHEDWNPVTRPGWDPGALRVDPDFHWGYVLQLLDARAA